MNQTAYRNAQDAYDAAEPDIDLVALDGGATEADGDEPEPWEETIWEFEN